jgi:putative transposase
MAVSCVTATAFSRVRQPAVDRATHPIRPRSGEGRAIIMGSFTQLTYHVVYATKYRHQSIVTDIRERLYQYIGGIIRAKKGHLIEIGGVADHVHILAQFSASVAIADVVRDIKANSSHWMNELPGVTRGFEWQKGYGAFTVSYSNIQKVRAYIQNQEEHHRKRTFEEEYTDFLNRHQITFRPEHLFEDEHQNTRADRCRRFAATVFVVLQIRGLTPTAICCHRFAIEPEHRSVEPEHRSVTPFRTSNCDGV